jgi:hypothetical protein
MTEESTGRVNDIMDCFRDYVVKAEGKLFEKEQKFPSVETSKLQSALEA